MNGETKKVDIEERLVGFAVMILNLAEQLPETRAGRYFHDQLIRSGVSPALNYGEAKSAESAADFIHKMKVCLKELRETFISLSIKRITGCNLKNLNRNVKLFNKFK